LASIPSGWRNNPSQPQRVALRGRDVLEVGYRFRRDGVEVEIDAEPGPQVMASEPGRVRIRIDGVERTFLVARYGSSTWVDGPMGASRFEEIPRFPMPEREQTPGSLRAPMPGAVIAVRAAKGQHVETGDVLVTIEAMKMEHAVRAPHSGTVTELTVEEGDQVEAGDVLAIVTLDEDDAS
jgi:propionyl-CoA carboxylase alpha chain